MRAIFSFLLLCLLPLFAGAQEMMFQVNISTPKIEGTEKKVFQTLQTALYEFINNRKWTNYVFKPEERIEGTMMITITDRISTDQFKAKMNLVVQRPVYKTSYTTNLLNLQDENFDFKYVEYEPLEFSEDVFTSNLTSLVAYYVYMALGIDADSYSRFGGTPYFEKARNVVNAAQNTPEKGWKAFEALKNRYWLAENFLNSSYSPLREGLYNYHRLGLDVMTENMDIGRSSVSEFLESLQRVNREKPNLFMVQVVLDAKRDEIINIYQQAAPMDKSRAVNILKEIEPSNSAKYQQILQQTR